MTERETVHFGPVSQCRTHAMVQDCGGKLPDCLVEKMPMTLPTAGFMTEAEAAQITERPRR